MPWPCQGALALARGPAWSQTRTMMRVWEGAQVGSSDPTMVRSHLGQRMGASWPCRVAPQWPWPSNSYDKSHYIL